MDILLAFTKADWLDSDEERILGKDVLHEVERVALVPVGKFYAENEPEHTPILRQVHPNKTSIHMLLLSSSTPSASDKYLMDLSNVLVPESLYL